MNFQEQYEKIKVLAKPELEIIEKNLIEDVHTREPLNSALKNFLTAPSKRIRPLLSILYLKANEENLSDKQLEILTVIELIHNASLIHDDIIDNSEIRRGIKTLCKEFDNKLAVISGDYILAIAMEKLAKIENIHILHKLSQTIRQMCLGEINQNFDRFKIGTIENYIEKTKNKTAYLFESSIVCSAMLSKKQHNFENITNLGLDIGIAFQIRDDIINMKKIDSSKPSNNDIKEGIFNAPIILGNKSDNYHSGIEKTKVLLNNYIESAENKIKILPNNVYKSALEEFLELLSNV